MYMWWYCFTHKHTRTHTHTHTHTQTHTRSPSFSLCLSFSISLSLCRFLRLSLSLSRPLPLLLPLPVNIPSTLSIFYWSAYQVNCTIKTDSIVTFQATSQGLSQRLSWEIFSKLFDHLDTLPCKCNLNSGQVSPWKTLLFYSNHYLLFFIFSKQ